MCTVSMIMDHYSDKWHELVPEPELPYKPTVPHPFTLRPINYEPLVTDEEIREFRTLLKRAREYDKRNNEPECELESKKQRVRELAEELGIGDKINFL